MGNREIKRSPTHEYRCDDRLKTKDEGSTHFTYTGFGEVLEHQKIKTRLINERFASVMGDGPAHDLDTMVAPL